MPYVPPPAMTFSPVNFGSMAPGPMPGQMPQGGLLNAASQAAQGNPQGGLAKQLFGNGQAPAAPGQAPAAPQMGLLTGMLQKLGMGGAAGAAPPGGASPTGGFNPSALTGLW